MSLLTTSKLNDADPFHIYYDLNILNNDTVGNSKPVSVVFNETRNTPYLLKPNQYFCSLVRFSLENVTTPVFIPQVQLNQGNPDNTIYSITLTYQGNEIQRFIQWTPQDLSQPLPAPPLDVQDFTSEYYFCYNQQHWIDLINDCFAQLVTQLNAVIPLPTLNAPFINYNQDTKICDLYVDQAGYDNTLANPIEIYFNTPLFTLFSSFDSTYFGYQNIINGKNYRIETYTKPGGLNLVGLPLLPVPVTPPTYNAIKMTQDDSTISLWNPVSAVVFTCSILPVNPSLTGLPKVWNSYANLLSNGNNSNVTSILTDIEVQDGQYRGTLVYLPEPEYRLFDIIGDSPVSGIQISCFWRTVFGSLVPFKLGAQCSGSLKLLFRRKDFNSVKE